MNLAAKVILLFVFTSILRIYFHGKLKINLKKLLMLRFIKEYNPTKI